MDIAPGSKRRRHAAHARYGSKFDGAGRVILTGTLPVHRRIGDAIAFGGLGHKLQIWESGRFRARLAGATAKVRALRKWLGSERAAESALGARE